MIACQNSLKINCDRTVIERVKGAEVSFAVDIQGEAIDPREKRPGRIGLKVGEGIEVSLALFYFAFLSYLPRSLSPKSLTINRTDRLTMCLLCREMYDARVPRLQRRLDARHDPNRDNPEKCAEQDDDDHVVILSEVRLRSNERSRIDCATLPSRLLAESLAGYPVAETRERNETSLRGSTLVFNEASSATCAKTTNFLRIEAQGSQS